MTSSSSEDIVSSAITEDPISSAMDLSAIVFPVVIFMTFDFSKLINYHVKFRLVRSSLTKLTKVTLKIFLISRSFVWLSNFSGNLK